MRYFVILLVLLSVFSLNLVYASPLLWENRVDGIVRSVDITNNGTYIVAGTEIADKKGDVYFFDNFGTILWKKDLDRIIGDVSISKDGSLVSASGYQLSKGPGKFYMNPSVYLFDNKGNLLWQYQNMDNSNLGTENQFLFGTMSSDNHVIIQSDHEILFLDESKNRMWNYTVNENIGRIKISKEGSVIAAGVIDYSKDNTWGLYVFDNPGNLLWKYVGNDGILQGYAFSISSNGDKIVLGSMPNGNIGTLYLFDKTGTILWKHDISGGILNADISDAGTSIVVGTNNGMFLFDGNGEKISADSTWSPDISQDGSVIVSFGPIKDGEYGVTFFDGKLDQIWQKKIPDVNAVKMSNDGSFVAVGASPRGSTGSFGQVFLMEGNTNKTVNYLDFSKVSKHVNDSPIDIGPAVLIDREPCCDFTIPGILIGITAIGIASFVVLRKRK